MAPLDNITLIALPYAALLVFLVGTIYRYKATKFRYSSLSSQFLEGRQLFWGSVPFHYGLLVVLAGHLVGFLFPRSVTAFNSVPLRLFILEATALAEDVVESVLQEEGVSADDLSARAAERAPRRVVESQL